MKIKSALISVSDKKELKDILKILNRFKVKLVSSGGTYKEIRSLGYKSIKISNYTNFPEILDGRIKTLHPKIYSGILYRRKNNNHKKILKKLNFEGIDLVITNFYPFKKTIFQTNKHEKIIENIDIGGPTLVRAAAKNYMDVTVITKTDQYKMLIKELNLHNGGTSLQFRKELSKAAFFETANYDSAIYNYFCSNTKEQPQENIFLNYKLVDKLRYGENPHQDGSIYSDDDNFGLIKLYGKNLSYNNYSDIFACLNLSKTLPKNRGVVIVKHANPCGVSIESDHFKSYISALNCDPISAFGGVISFNYKISIKIAKQIIKNYFEVIIANGFDNNALKILKTKKKTQVN